MIDLHHGDSLEVLPTLEAESVDSIITDSPYGLEFMGKDWDHGVPGVPFWAECLRVAKPGAMLLAFGGTRTHHRLMCAIEDAGWEIRDCLMWLYGSGFPKSHDISKALDKAAGAEREVVGKRTVSRDYSRNGKRGDMAISREPVHSADIPITAPATLPAQLWDGWGTALKPAWEPIILAMKPLPGTFAQNALDYGVAGLWVDGCRVATNGEQITTTWSHSTPQEGWDRPWRHDPEAAQRIYERKLEGTRKAMAMGRWPANLVLDEHAAAMLDEQSGERSGGHFPVRQTNSHTGGNGIYGHFSQNLSPPRDMADTGGASRFFQRFFYTAKASRSEREAGLIGHIPCIKCGGLDTVTHINPKTGKEEKCIRNGHPTVKPLELCRWLCRLTKTPTGGVVLDPFMGSGTIPLAAVLEGRDVIGIEQERASFDVAQVRIEAAQSEMIQARMMV